ILSVVNPATARNLFTGTSREHSSFVAQGKQKRLCHGRNPRGRQGLRFMKDAQGKKPPLQRWSCYNSARGSAARMTFIQLIGVFLLVVLNGFFAAVEFS